MSRTREPTPCAGVWMSTARSSGSWPPRTAPCWSTPRRPWTARLRGAISRRSRATACTPRRRGTRSLRARSCARSGLHRTLAGDHGPAGDADLFEDCLGDLFRELGLFPERLLGRVAALADELALVGDPSPLLLENPVLEAEVEEGAGRRDALVVHDVELDLREGRGDLVLHHLDLGAVADDLALGRLDLVLAADVDAYRREELQRPRARSRLRGPEHDSDLLADDRRQAAHGLGHQPGLASHGHVAHLAVELGLGHEGGNRVHDDDIDAVGAYERLHDVEGVLAAVGLGHEQVVELHAHHARIFRVESVLHVDECGQSALALALGDHAQAEGGLTRRLGPVDLDDAAERQAADSERQVDRKRAG